MFLLPLEMPRIEAALRDAEGGSPEARWIAAMALGREAGERRNEALEALKKLLIDSCEEVRAQALEGIAEQKRTGAEVDGDAAAELLQDKEACVRCAAVESASILLDDPIRAIRPFLRDADPSVRAAAAKALGEMEAAAEADLLAEILDDQDEFVARCAAMALAALDDFRCEPALVSLLDGETTVACEAAFALGELGGAASLPALRKAAKRRLSSLELRTAAATAMARCSAPDGKELLAAMLSSRSSNKRAIALGAIARLPVAGMASAVGRLMESGRPGQVSSAIRALISIAEVDREAALHELKKHIGKLGSDLEDELNDAIDSIAGVG